MSKNKLKISDIIMSEIKSGQLKMKPKWYFVLGSILAVLGISALFITSSYLVSLFAFSLRTHGPMGQIRFDQLVSEFPLWAPVVAIFGIVFGIIMLREYEFSYKNNFSMLIMGIVSAIILAGVLMDYFNINLIIARRGIGQSIYQKYDGRYKLRQKLNIDNQDFQYKMRGKYNSWSQ